MNILDLAQSVGRKPSSSAFRSLITSSSKYGLTDGSYNAPQLQLTPRGLALVAPRNDAESEKALFEAAMAPPPFGAFYTRYDRNKFPQDQIALNVLERNDGIPSEISKECLGIIKSNANFVGLTREISGSIYVDLSAAVAAAPAASNGAAAFASGIEEPQEAEQSVPPEDAQMIPEQPPAQRKIFIGHGKNTKPADQLEKLLARFKIPFARAMDEPNRGRPISQKVEETMRSCAASILIFTADEEFRDTEGNTIWRPSENVVHELGAASVMHGNNIVIFKEDRLVFPTNFRDIGHISFETDKLDAKGAELITELVAVGLLSLSVG